MSISLISSRASDSGASHSITQPRHAEPSESLSVSRDWKLITQDEILDVFNACKAPNWDGEGALAVNLAALSKALLFLSKLPDAIIPPAISADAEGEILFDWQGKQGELFTVCINDVGRYLFAAQLTRFQGVRGSGHIFEPHPLDLSVFLLHRFPNSP